MRSGKNLLLASAAVVLTLGLAEAVLRLLVPLPDPHERLKWHEDDVHPQYVVSQFDPNLAVTFVAEPGLPGLSGPTTFSTNNAGFRGETLRVPKPIEEYRVFVVGASTTECLLLDDRDALPAVVQRELQERAPVGRPIRVYGVAKSGDRTDDHVAMTYNDVLRELARERSIPVYDSVREIPKSQEFFYDDVHFNVAGARRAGRGLSAVIADRRFSSKARPMGGKPSGPPRPW